MTREEFWSIIAAARAATRSGDSPAGAVVGLLRRAGADQVLEFEDHLQELSATLYRSDVLAAAHLIGDGCSDDRFADFRAGVISLGQGWYDRVIHDPDALAEYEPVRASVASGDFAIFDEEFVLAASTAYEALSGDSEAFWEARQGRPELPESEAAEEGTGEQLDFDDVEQVRTRLPRLYELFATPRDRDDPVAATGPRTVEIRRVSYESGQPVETSRQVEVGKDGNISTDDMRAMIKAMLPQRPPRD